MRRKRLSGVAAMLLVFVGLVAADVRAQEATELVSNLGQPYASEAVVGTNDSGRWSAAQQFTTGDNANGYVVTAIVVDDRINISSKPRVSIYTDNSGSPGTSRYVLTTPSSLLLHSSNTYTAPANTTLDKETKYWVVIENQHTANHSGVRFSVGATNSNTVDSGAASGWDVAEERYVRSSTDWTSHTDELRIAINGYAQPPDTTAPAVSTATVNGPSLVLTFDEDLAAAANLANAAFTVKQGTDGVTLSSTPPAIAGATVTLTLATAVEHGASGFTVSYARPDSGTDNALEDAAGNEVADFTDRAVSNLTPDEAAAPTVVSIARHSPSSSPTNADSLVWRVTFSKDVAGVDAADFAIVRTTATATLAVEAVAGSSSVYDVTASGGNLADLDGTVTLSFAPGQDVEDLSGQALENTAPTGVNGATYVVDNTAPAVDQAMLDGTELVIAFDEDLAAASLTNAAFTVKLGPADVALSSTPPVISDFYLTLTLATAAEHGASGYKVSYAKPTTGNVLADEVGNEVPDFTGVAVWNITRDPFPPPMALVSNTGQTSSSQFGVTGGVSAVAQQFTAGDQQGGYVLTGVVVALGWVGGHSDPKVSIFTDASGVPGSSLYVLTNPMSFSSYANNSFTAPEDATLDANTKYWVVLENDDTTNLRPNNYAVAVTDSGELDSGAANGWGFEERYHRQQLPVNEDWRQHPTRRLMIAITGYADAAAVESIYLTGAEVGPATGIVRGSHVDIAWEVASAIPAGANAVIEYRTRYFWDQPGEPFSQWKPVAHGNDFEPCTDGSTTCVTFTLDELFRGEPFTLEMRIVEDGTEVETSPPLKAAAPSADANPLEPRLTVALDEATAQQVDPATGPFVMELQFTEPYGSGYLGALLAEAVQELAPEDFEIENGTVTAIEDWDGGTYKVKVTPTALGEPVTISLPSATVKGVGEGLTEDGTNDFTRDNIASNEVVTRTATGNEQRSGDPLTAAFLDAPVSHDGSSAFTLRLSFSEEVEISPEDLRDHALSANGGAVTGVSRVGGAKDLFEVTVTPDGEGPVSVRLVPAPGGCAVEGAVCTDAGTALTSLLLTSVRGPGPGLTVADAVATEGTDTSLDFVVTLSPASSETVTVDYATSNGTATAGDDYTATSGTLTFAPGDTVKTVSVAIVDDGVEDSGETMTLTLSGATNAAIDDGEALGTIHNTEALTAAFSELPSEHDGSGAFTFELTFSEDVEGLSFRTLKFGGIEVAGGTVTKAKRHGPGVNQYWTIHVEPDGNGPVTVVLPETTDCAVAGAVCAPDGRMLSNESRATVEGRMLSNESRATVEGPPIEPLTASFSSVPSEHDGSGAFTFELTFSEDVEGLSFRTLKFGGIETTGGTVTRARRHEPGWNRHWTIHVEPDGNGPVTVVLPETTDCAAAGAVCAPDGRMLSNESRATVQGPPGLSVADAEVDEAAEDAALAFTVTLDREASGTVTVDYETSDDTAVAPGDYTATSGTLTFAAGEVEKTVSVPVVSDAEDEGDETMTLTLSGPSGAYLADAEATGTIHNAGPIPQAWLARFGRTVADQVLEAVDARLRGARTPGIEAVVAGQALSFDSSPGDADAVAAREEEARTQALTAWLRGEDGEKDRAALSETRTVTARELFTGTSFSLTGGSAEGGTVSAWGRGTVSSFDGREEGLTLDGEVGNLMLGADWTRGRATAGLLLSHAQGSGGYRGESAGGIEASLTGLYPYGRYALNDRLSVWGVAGYGEGTLRVAPEEQAALETDMDLAMASVGVRGILMKAPAGGGAELAVRSDAMAVRTTSEAVSGSGGNLAASEADVTRLRLGLEGSRALRFGDGASLTPSVELGVRHDGGDAETGFGADVGAGLAWSDPARGLSADARARGLLTHEDGSFRERGFAGSLAWDPAPQSERGPSLSLTQTVGAQASGGVEALLGPQTAKALEAANDNDPGSGSGAAGDELERRALEAKLGYGFALFDDRWTGTPALSLGLTGTSRETVLGWRLAEEKSAGLTFGLDVEAARQESAGTEAGHRFGLEFGWRLEGAGAEAFEVRFEGSRLEPANDGAEHRIGLTLNARW